MKLFLRWRCIPALEGWTCSIRRRRTGTGHNFVSPLLFEWLCIQRARPENNVTALSP